MLKQIRKIWLINSAQFNFHSLFQSPKPEQSVMQALESLNEQQVFIYILFIIYI